MPRPRVSNRAHTNRSSVRFNTGSLGGVPDLKVKAPKPRCDVCTSDFGVEDGLCAGCRKLATNEPPACGTYAGYANGCECEPCRTAHLERLADYNAKRKANA